MSEKKTNWLTSKTINTDHILPVLVCALAIPLSMSMWLFNITYSRFIEIDKVEDFLDIHPVRWLIASTISITMCTYGLNSKSITISGALLGCFVAMILTIGSYAFCASLLIFFVTSSKATKYKSNLKSKFEEDFKEGGQRTWINVLCNGGMATQLGLLYLIDVGCGERPINFSLEYRPSWLAMGILGCFACCNGDTWASELGTVLATNDPYLITTRKKVPRGTNGGVTLIGTLVSGLGGLAVGSAFYLTIIYTTDKALLIASPPQWPILLTGFLGGLIGSLIDSILGATLQYSGINMKGTVVSCPGKGVIHISGRRLLDNHSVNLISTVIMGFVTPYIAMIIWPL